MSAEQAGIVLPQMIGVALWAVALALLQVDPGRGRSRSAAVARTLGAAVVGGGVYAMIGFGISYGFGGADELIALRDEASPDGGEYRNDYAIESMELTDRFFQSSFAGLATALAACGFAGRVRWWAEPISWAATSLVYAVGVGWVWGGGWLLEMGFHDFAGGLLIVGFGGSVAVGAALFGRRASDESEHRPALAWLGVLLLAMVAIGPPAAVDGTIWVGWYGAAAAIGVAVAASAAAGLAIRHAPQPLWCAAAVVMAFAVVAAAGEAVSVTTAAGLGFLAGVLGPTSYTSARMLGIADRAGVAGPAVDGATLAAIVVAIAHEEGSWVAQMIGLIAILGMGVALGAAVAVAFRAGGVREQA